MFRSPVTPVGIPAPLLLFLALTAALSSCDFDSSAGNPTRETLPGGGVLVRHPGLPAIDSVGPEVTEVEIDLRFGSREGDDPNLLFGDIRGIQAASDGTIYVLDYTATEVRAYDSEGRFLRTVARRGEGPGEITAANGIFLAGDTLLWIHDTRQRTIFAVTPDGEEVRRFTNPVTGYARIWDGTFDNVGRYRKLIGHPVGERTHPPPMGLSSVTSRAYYKSHHLSTGAVDSVYLGEVTGRSYAYSTPERPYGFLGIRFEASGMNEVNPSGGFWRANSAAYRIARVGEDEDTLVVIEAGLAVQPVTDEDRSAYVETILEVYPALRREAEEVAALMPDTKPILAGMIVDDAGRLWVERVTPADAPAFYDRFSEDGDYLGSVRFGFEPAPYSTFWIQHDDIYTWVVDDLGVPYVVRAPLS